MTLVEHTIKPGVLMLSVSGNLDLYSAPELKECIHQNPVEYLILNLEDCEFIDSSGLGTLIQLRMNHAEKIKHVFLTRVSSRIQHLLELTNTITQFPVYPTLEEALAAIPS